MVPPDRPAWGHGSWRLFCGFSHVDRLLRRFSQRKSRPCRPVLPIFRHHQGTNHEIHHCNRGAGRRLAACGRRAGRPAAPQFGDPVALAMGDADPMLDARLRWEDVDATSKSPMPSPCACAPVSS
jgi:hypothetical protein